MMFHWFRRFRFVLPARIAANPGKGTAIHGTFSNGSDSWQESLDLLDALAATLQDEKVIVKRHPQALELPGGIIVQPALVSFQPVGGKAVQTCTTIQANHPEAFPDGVFEYQHSGDERVGESITKSFQVWAQADLPVLQDSLLAQPGSCTAMEMAFPAQEASLFSELNRPRVRRVIFGHPVHTAYHPPNMPEPEGEEVRHPFCPCCLFTNCLEAFRPLIGNEAFYGIRLFAMRGPEGASEAECRINGEDFPAGKQALIDYVNRWPDLGFEVRKQFVVLQTVKSPATA